MGGSLGNRDDTINYYKKYEHKCNKDMRYLKKQNKMLYNISKKSGLRHELKKIKNIRAKDSKKRRYSSSDSSSSGLDYDSYVSSDSDQDEEREPNQIKDMNKLDHIVTYNINKNKNQHNDAIGNKIKFDSTVCLSSGTKDPLPVVTVILRGVKK